MSKIISLQDLKNAKDLSAECNASDSPIFITNNGQTDMVIMSLKQYERSLAKRDIYELLEKAEVQIASEAHNDAYESLARMRDKRGV